MAILNSFLYVYQRVTYKKIIEGRDSSIDPNRSLPFWVWTFSPAWTSSLRRVCSAEIIGNLGSRSCFLWRFRMAWAHPVQCSGQKVCTAYNTLLATVQSKNAWHFRYLVVSTIKNDGLRQWGMTSHILPPTNQDKAHVLPGVRTSTTSRVFTGLVVSY